MANSTRPDNENTYPIYIHPDMQDEDAFIRKITKETFTRQRTAVAGPVMYLKGGSEKYEDYTTSNETNDQSQKTRVARSVEKMGKRLAAACFEVERLVLIGTGTASTFEQQELELIERILEKQRKTKAGQQLKEIVIVDVAIDSIKQAMDQINELCLSNPEIDSMSIAGIQSRFESVSGQNFDNIMQEFGLRSRDKVEAAAISLGATFGNIEDTQLEAFPSFAVDQRKALLAGFVGDGSKVIFDHFTSLKEGKEAYNSAAATEFIQHGLGTMAESCLPGHRIMTKSDADNDMFVMSAELRREARAITHSIISKQDHDALISNGHDTTVEMTIDKSSYRLMISLRPKPHQVSERPSVNTGLSNEFYGEHDKHAIHCDVRIGEPGILQRSYTRADDVSIPSEEITHEVGKPSMAERILKPLIAGRSRLALAQ